MNFLNKSIRNDSARKLEKNKMSNLENIKLAELALKMTS